MHIDTNKTFGSDEFGEIPRSSLPDKVVKFVRKLPHRQKYAGEAAQIMEAIVKLFLGVDHTHGSRRNEDGEVEQEVKVQARIDAHVASHRRRFAYKSFFRKFGFYLLFLALVIIAASLMTTGFSVEIYSLHRTAVSALVEENFPLAPIKKSFEDIGGAEEMWEWVHGPFIDAVFKGDGEAEPMKDSNIMIGQARIRQLRVKGVECVTSARPGPRECYPEYSAALKDTEPFGEGPGFSFAGDLNALERYGLGDSQYDSGGFAVYLSPLNATAARETILHLQESDWVDTRTRALFFNLNYYNENLEQLVLLQFSVEFRSSGLALPDFRFHAIPWSSQPTDTKRFLEAVQIILLGIQVYMLGLECKDLRAVWLRHGLGKRDFLSRFATYLFSDFNLWDLLTVFMFVMCTAWHFLVIAEMQRQLSGGLTEDRYYELEELGRLVDFERDAIALFVLVSVGKILKYVQLIPEAGPAMQAIIHTVANSMIRIFLCFFVSFTAVVSLSFHFAFGHREEGYFTFERSWFSVLRSLFGELDFSFVEGNKGYGRAGLTTGFAGLMWTLLLILGNLIIMNIVIAVINAVYEEARSSYSKDNWENMLTRLMAEELWERLQRPKRKMKRTVNKRTWHLPPLVKRIKNAIALKRRLLDLYDDFDGGKREPPVSVLSQDTVNRSTERREHERKEEKGSEQLELIDKHFRRVTAHINSQEGALQSLRSSLTSLKEQVGGLNDDFKRLKQRDELREHKAWCKHDQARRDRQSRNFGDEGPRELPEDLQMLELARSNSLAEHTGQVKPQYEMPQTQRTRILS
mmetsp:Transcript_19731/g.46129  ORF Transcript_19731/g.46129 Transcript_19731/m.46129 type:complete len:803 (-) Transcript_19731:338-2746(-)